MTVILYMATSINGMIAQSNDDTDWISDAEWDSYAKTAQEIGCLVVGRRTYEILTKESGYPKLKDVKIVVVSSGQPKLVAEHHAMAFSPQEALEMLKDKKKVMVAGGGKLNAAFLEQGLVDEIFIDVEPVLLSRSIPLTDGANFPIKGLSLIDTRRIGPDGIQLHYSLSKTDG